MMGKQTVDDGDVGISQLNLALKRRFSQRNWTSGSPQGLPGDNG
jgi:hypothetical protein